ncbi:shieldin complex subunit 2 isoform X2 [Hoplias malabaricus]|uniref:shieldin complex subunit 2 isoform X2 n=1 Tax=Hoplias malabaricus TaxID=27720 RepID=UPI003463282B
MMANKPKIHVFMGAPHPSSVSNKALEKESFQWNTLELCWSQKGLRPRTEASEDQSHFECDGHTSDDQGDYVENIDKLKPSTVNEKQSFLGCNDASKSASENDSTPSICTSSRAEQAHPENDFCPGVVTEYLDSCFPSPQPGPSTDPTITHPQSNSAISVETEYLTIWTRSQGLLLRGGVVKQHEVGSLGTPRSPQASPKQTHLASGTPRSPQTSPQQTPLASLSSPDLYSPEVSPSQRGLGGTLQGSVELFNTRWSHRHQEGGVGLESTPDGILCSQTNPPGRTEAAVEQEDPGLPVSSPNYSKKTSPAPSSSKRARTSPTATKGQPKIGQKSVIPLCGPTTLLSRCRSHGVRYSILVAVVHPCHLKEIKVRAGASAGSSVPLASVIVTDQSGVEMKVVLWRTAAFWALTVYPGDIVLISDVTLHEDKWRGETVLQSSYISRLLNLGQVTQTHIPQAWRDGAEGVSRTGSVLKAVLNVEQGDSMPGAVVLWGSALAWLQRLHSNKDAIWEFRLLLVKQDVTSGLMELHSTPWSSCQPLFPDDPRCREFYNKAFAHRGSSSFEIDLHTLLSQKYTGDVELKVQISAFRFQSSPSQDTVQLLDQNTPLERILEVVCGDITFPGCGLCCAELDTDENGIYRPCYPCLPHTGVRRYYRPVVLTVKEGEHQVCVQVPPILVQKILLNTSPDKLNKSVAPASEERFIHILARRIHSILSNPRTTFHLTVRSHFECDENGIPTAQNFLLLDFNSQEA